MKDEFRIGEPYAKEIFTVEAFRNLNDKLNQEETEKRDNEVESELNEEEKIMTFGEDTADTIIHKMIKSYLEKCFEARKEIVINELKQIKIKLESSELETFYPKHNHSVVATKDFVFITGGDYNNKDNTFEIICVKDNSYFRGPDLNNYRHSHSSFIHDDYLYVVLGAVQDGFYPTMSYERIKIPNTLCSKSLETFYADLEWEQGEIQSDFSKNSYFKCFNSFKNYESTVHIFGQVYNLYYNEDQKDNYGSPQNYARITLGIDINTKIITVEQIHELVVPDQKVNDNKSKESAFIEQVHVPFYDRGDWYLPIVTRNYNYVMKWDPTDLIYI